MNIRLLIAALLVVGLSPAAGGAQTPVAGDEVRIRIRTPLMEGYGRLDLAGVFSGMTADSLSGTFRNEPRTIPIESILRLQVERERSRGRGAARGMLVGVLAAGVAGMVIGAASPVSDSRPLISESVDSGLTAGAVLAIPGALVGGLIGALLPGTRWETVPLD